MFASTFYMAENTPSRDNNVFSNYKFIETIYEYLYFVWEEQDFENWKADMWLWWALAGLFVGLIMSNLLITIVSETYAEVSEKDAITDSHAMNDVILELEIYLCCKRGSKKR
jgi:hypothetical protein